MAKGTQFLVLIYLGSYLLSKCLNNVLWKIVMLQLPSYPYVLGTLQSILYLPLYWGANWMFTSPESSISASKIPKKEYAIIGALNALVSKQYVVSNKHTTSS